MRKFKKIKCQGCNREFLLLKYVINRNGKRLKVCNKCASEA